MTQSDHTQDDAGRDATLRASSALCVLIVEDDPPTQERLELLMEQAGLSAVSVGSIKSAIEALAAVFFPIIIVDRMLEDGDGLKLLEDIRQRARRDANGGRPFVLLLSAYDSQADIEAGLAAGADDYLSKRDPDDKLLARLKDAARVVRMPTKP